MHIINTSTPTRVDFRAVAVDVAKLVAGDRQVNYLDSDGVRAQAEVVDDLIVPFGVDGDDLGDALRVEIQPSSFASVVSRGSVASALVTMREDCMYE